MEFHDYVTRSLVEANDEFLEDARDAIDAVMIGGKGFLELDYFDPTILRYKKNDSDPDDLVIRIGWKMDYDGNWKNSGTAMILAGFVGHGPEILGDITFKELLEVEDDTSCIYLARS